MLDTGGIIGASGSKIGSIQKIWRSVNVFNAPFAPRDAISSLFCVL